MVGQSSAFRTRHPRYGCTEGLASISLGNIEVLFCLYFTVDLISIDRRSRDREAECLERAAVLAKRFLESVQDTADYVWKPPDRSPPEPDRCVFLEHIFSPFNKVNLFNLYFILYIFFYCIFCICSPEPPNVVDSHVITVSRERDRSPGKLKQFAILFR